LPFVHLHTHSDYSFLDALPKAEDLAQKAKELGMPAVALTDRANMHGAIEFYKACKKEGVNPIIGGEFYLAPRSRNDKEQGIDNKRFRIVLLAENNEGYQNLLQLSTLSYLEGIYYVPRIDDDLLQKYGKNLIAILPRAGGEITPLLEHNELEKAVEKAERFQKIFPPENLFIETTPRPNSEEEGTFQSNLKKFCTQTGIAPVATNDMRYLEKEEREVHDTLICMEYSLQKTDADRISYLEHDLSFWSEAEMKDYFYDFLEAVENTGLIADRCHYEFEFGVNRLPQFPIPEGFSNDKEYLRFLCEKGVEKRYGQFPPDKGGRGGYEELGIGGVTENLQVTADHDQFQITAGHDPLLNVPNRQEILDRLNFELATIDQMGFNSYFLIVADFVQWAKNNGIAVGPGRGSAAGAIIAYLLEITDLDPLYHGLYFERFLNPERVSMPDIDIDFSDVRRDEVLEYVRGKYGRDCVAHVCTFGTMAARAAVKDVGRAFGVPFSDMNDFAKLIPEKPGTTLEEAFEQSKDLREKLKSDETLQKIFETAKRIEGNIRHVSVHACAVMITPEPIVKYTALMPAPKDANSIITQYQAKPLDMLGLLKMDFLGLRNLSILEKTLQHIKDRHGVEINLSTLPLDDEASFLLLSGGETTGVFQLESSGMTRYLKELCPTKFEDLVAMVSLYRPGPMKFIPDYIAGKHGKKVVKYPHPSLEKVLSPTFGIAVYQEQILEIAKIFGGFSLGGADLLRRAIGKKIASELAAQREKFIEGAKAQGHAEKLAIQIFDEVIEPFAGYGFNKSHAACYAMIAYQTAYLKAHYPVEFLAGLLSCDEENTDRVIIDIAAARRMKIDILPPSVKTSEGYFTILDDRTIRFGLNAIKGIGESVVEKILEARKKEGFENFADFLSKCGGKAVNKKSLEALAKAGALEEYEKTEKILANEERILEYAKSHKEDTSSLQDDLFGMHEVEVEVQDLSLPDAEPLSLAHKLRLEKEVLGLYVSDHPLRGMGPYLLKKGTPIAQIPQKVRFSPKKAITVCGLVESIKKIVTKKKTNMAIVLLEDLSRKIEVVFFPSSYEKNGEKLQPDVLATITGKAEKKDGEWQILAENLEIEDLGIARKKAEEQGLLSEETILSAEEAEEMLEGEEGGGELRIRNEELGIEEEEGELGMTNYKLQIEGEENGELRMKNEGLGIKEEGGKDKTVEDVPQQGVMTPCSDGNILDTTEGFAPLPAPWQIIIPEKISKEKLERLFHLLKTHPGNTVVNLVFHGGTHPFHHGVAQSEELKKNIEEILF